jgi:uncharacterized protein (DUF433 family)
MTRVASSTSLLERITINPQRRGGRPCISGMRSRVIDVRSNLGTLRRLK